MSTDDWVPPDAFRVHVRQLVGQTGLSWRMIAAHAGVAPRALHALLHGRRHGQPVRRLHVSVARALAATSVESIAETATSSADAGPPRALLQALLALGWSREVLAQFLTDEDFDRLEESAGVSCSEATRIRVEACYDHLTSPAPGGLPTRPVVVPMSGPSRVRTRV